jgi:hypothetical protein
MSASEAEFRPLANSEMALIRKLLSADFRGRDELAQQLTGLQAMTLDAAGNLKLKVSGEGRAPIGRGVAVEAKYLDLDAENEVGPRVHVLLHVVDGKLSMLEIYKDDGSKILKFPEPDKLEIFPNIVLE